MELLSLTLKLTIYILYYPSPLPPLPSLSFRPPLPSPAFTLPSPSLPLTFPSPSCPHTLPTLPLSPLPFLYSTSLPSLSLHPPLPSLPSSPSMQAIQNLGLAVVAIVAGKIVDVKGYLVYEVFNCALLCCESTLATQGVAWGGGGASMCVWAA